MITLGRDFIGWNCIKFIILARAKGLYLHKRNSSYTLFQLHNHIFVSIYNTAQKDYAKHKTNYFAKRPWTKFKIYCICISPQLIKFSSFYGQNAQREITSLLFISENANK